MTNHIRITTSSTEINATSTLIPIEQQRLELETLLDTLPMPVFFKDNTLCYRRANLAACAFLGLNSAQIVGRRAVDLFPETLAKQIDSEDMQVLSRQSPLITPDMPLSNASGSLYYFTTYKSPVIDDNGQIAGLLDLMLDVSDRKIAESERLTSLQSQRDALVQEVHHRIKNHLQGVIGLLQRIISNNQVLKEPLRSVLSQIESIAGIHGLQSSLGKQCLQIGQIADMIAQLTPGEVVVGGNGLAIELPRQESVPFALTLNELVNNALKHRVLGGDGHIAYIDIHLQATALIIQVRCGPASLPVDFDFAAGVGLGTGLRLLKTLLPRRYTELQYQQSNNEVIAELKLMPPLIRIPIQKAL